MHACWSMEIVMSVISITSWQKYISIESYRKNRWYATNQSKSSGDTTLLVFYKKLFTTSGVDQLNLQSSVNYVNGIY